MDVGYGLLRLPSFVAVAHGASDARELPEIHPEEAAYVHTRALNSRRRDFTWGRAAAHRALAILGEDRGPIGRGENREPQWPGDAVGSITHAAGQVVAAVAHHRDSAGIGIDLEDMERFFPQLIEHIAFGPEAERLLGLPEADRPAATIELFAAKEAIFKAFFPQVGEFFGFTAAEVVPEVPGRYQGRFVADLHPDYPPTTSFPITTLWLGDLVLASVVLPA
jgi:4'-phosphopantetheinyl transferase EntD